MWIGTVADALTGVNESMEVVPLPGNQGTRISAHLSPRSRLELSWRAESDANSQLPPLLSVQGEIAIDVDAASMRTLVVGDPVGARGATDIGSET